MRIVGHPVLPDLSTDEVKFTFNGEAYTALEGEPVAAALLAHGIRKLRVSPRAGEARGIYCGIGHCYECRIWLNDDTQVRACLTPATEGDSFASERAEA